jgi:hypothetical protein
MDCYYHNIVENVIYVPLEQIGISNPIINAVKEKGKCIEKKYKLDHEAPQFGSLSRMNSFNINKDILPPISLKPCYDYYAIIDGRHRVALSIINNKTYIPAILF